MTPRREPRGDEFCREQGVAIADAKRCHPGPLSSDRSECFDGVHSLS